MHSVLRAALFVRGCRLGTVFTETSWLCDYHFSVVVAGACFGLCSEDG